MLSQGGAGGSVRFHSILVFSLSLFATGFFAQASTENFHIALAGQSKSQAREINRKIREAVPSFKTAEEHWKNRIECSSAHGKTYAKCLKEAGATKTPHRSYLIRPPKQNPAQVVARARKYHQVRTYKKEIERIIRQHKKDFAVITFHGLTSTPYAMAHHSMQIAGASALPVFGMTLSGHGTNMIGDRRCRQNPLHCDGSNTSALAHVTYKHWLHDLAFATDLVVNKHGYKKVILMGHSTGGKLIQAAAIHPAIAKYVAGALLMSPPENSNNALVASEFLKQIARRGGGALGIANTANYLYVLNTMCGMLDDESVARTWMEAAENLEFYKEFRFANGEKFGGPLRYLWISALAKPKAPSKIQYRSPTVGSVCALRDLIQHVKRLAGNHGVQPADGMEGSGDRAIKTKVHLQIGLRDNLIETEHAKSVFSRSTWIGTHRGWVKYKRMFSVDVMQTAGHSSYLIPFVQSKGRRVADPLAVNVGTWHSELGAEFSDYDVQNRALGETHFGRASNSIKRRIRIWRCENYRNPQNFVDPSFRPLQIVHGCQVH